MNRAPRRTLPEKLRLGQEIVRGYVRARRALRGGDVRGALTVLRDRRLPRDEVEPIPVDAAIRLGRAVSRAFVVLPPGSRCLMQSLVLVSMMARRGTSGTLIIGVRPGERFGAHAWVELDGRPLLAPGGTQFARLVEL